MVAAQLFNQENWAAFAELIIKVGQELRKALNTKAEEAVIRFPEE